MKTGINITVVLLFSLVSTVSVSEDLMQVYTLALKSDPQRLAELSAQQAVGELEQQAWGRFLPKVTLSANSGHVWQDSSAAASKNYKSDDYSVNLTQALYRKQDIVQKNQANIAVESARARLLVIEQGLIVRVAEGYFKVLASQDNVMFTVTEREAIALQLDQMHQRFDVGLATITDVVESQAAYDLANAFLIAAENGLVNSKEALRETTGLYLDSLSVLQVDIVLLQPEPLDSGAWSQTALRQNPNLRVAKSAIEAASQAIELQKSGHYPRLDIVGKKSYNSQGASNVGGGSDIQQDSIGVQLTLPLYAGGSVQSKVRAAGHRLNQAMHSEEQQRRAVVRQSREAYHGVISGISRVKALKQALVSGEKALESTEAGYDVGTRTTVDVLNVRRDLFRARRNYASSRYDYILSTLRLKQAAGTIGVDDLNQINHWLTEQ